MSVGSSNVLLRANAPSNETSRAHIYLSQLRQPLLLLSPNRKLCPLQLTYEQMALVMSLSPATFVAPPTVLSAPAVKLPAIRLHSTPQRLPLRPFKTTLRLRWPPRMAGDPDDDEPADGFFGFKSLWRTCQFVTLWWSLWSLYDFYLTPYSPAPELAILAGAAGYSWSEERRRPLAQRRRTLLTRRRQRLAQATSEASGKPEEAVTGLPTPWPCTSEGCSAED